MIPKPVLVSEDVFISFAVKEKKEEEREEEWDKLCSELLIKSDLYIFNSKICPFYCYTKMFFYKIIGISSWIFNVLK